MYKPPSEILLFELPEGLLPSLYASVTASQTTVPKGYPMDVPKVFLRDCYIVPPPRKEQSGPPSTSGFLGRNTKLAT